MSKASAVHADSSAKENFAGLLEESFGAGQHRRHRAQGQGDRHRGTHRRHRCRPEIRRPRGGQGIRSAASAPRSDRRRGRGYLDRHGRHERRGRPEPREGPREEAWTLLEKSFKENQRVTGVIFGRVKGGFTVTCPAPCLPARQPGRHPPGARRSGPLMGTPAALRSSDGPRPRQHRGVAPGRARGERSEGARRAGRQPQGGPSADRRG